MMEPMQSVPMYCTGCGAERTVPASAADPGACACGCSTRSSQPPRALLGVLQPLEVSTSGVSVGSFLPPAA